MGGKTAWWRRCMFDAALSCAVKWCTTARRDDFYKRQHIVKPLGGEEKIRCGKNRRSLGSYTV